MLGAIRLLPSIFRPVLAPPRAISVSSVRFQQAKFRSSKAQPDRREGEDMAQKESDHESSKDVDPISHPFGEGYATRSDEEGFGGVYSANQRFPAKDGGKEDAAAHENSQGSEVKEKEKGRNQPHGGHAN